MSSFNDTYFGDSNVPTYQTRLAELPGSSARHNGHAQLCGFSLPDPLT